MAIVVLNVSRGWLVTALLCLLIIQDFVAARPVTIMSPEPPDLATTTSAAPSKQPPPSRSTTATMSSSLPSSPFITSLSLDERKSSSSSSSPSSSPPQPPPSPPPTSTEFLQSESKSNTKSIELTSSLLKNLLMQVMEDRGERNNSTDDDVTVTTNDGEVNPKEDDHNDSIPTLTLVAIIALVIAVFIFALFIAVLCPHKIHPKLLLKHCPDFPSFLLCTRCHDNDNDRRHNHHYHNHHPNHRHHHHHHHCHYSDANNSTATIINESISSSSATSNQNFNVNNDENCCNCLKHTNLDTNTQQPELFICSNFHGNTNTNAHHYPTIGRFPNFQSEFPLPFHTSQQWAMGMNQSEEARSNELRRQTSGASLHSNRPPSQKDVHDKQNTHRNTIHEARRQNSRSSIHSNQNQNHHHQQIDEASSNPGEIVDYYGLRKQNSRSNLRSNEHRSKQIANEANSSSAIIRITPKPTSENKIVIMPTNGRNHMRTFSHVTPLENNIIAYHQTEAHSGGSHENANLNTGAVNFHGNAVGLPESHSTGSRRSNGRRPSMILMEDGGCPSCPYCEMGGVHVERTWVDHENRQHSAL